MKRANHTNNGFSIAQVLVASVFLGLITVAITSLINNSQKAQKNVQNSIDFDLTKSMMHMFFSSQSCALKFTDTANRELQFNVPGTLTIGANYVPNVESSLNLNSISQGALEFVSRTQLQASGLKVLRFAVTFARYSSDSTLPHPTTNVATNYKVFESLITLEVEKVAGSLGRKTLKADLAVKLLAENSGIVSRCAPPTFGSSTTAVPSGMTDAGYFYIDGTDLGPLRTTGSQPAKDAHKVCNAQGKKLCSQSQIFLTCDNNIVSAPSAGICVDAGTSNQAFVTQNDCQTKVLNSQPGCGGAYYRCCKDK